MVLGLAIGATRSPAGEAEPSAPGPVAVPSIPEWDRALDGDVGQAQGPGGVGTRAPSPLRTPLSGPNSPIASAGPSNAPVSGAFSPEAMGGGAAAEAAPARLGVFQMIGDQSPLLTLRPAPAIPPVPATPQPFPPGAPPPPPSPRQATALAPSVRGFKISENQSPIPQDRIFYTFNYYYNLNSAVDRRFDTPVNNLRAYREIFGFEKTFDQGRASIGFRLPLDTLYATSTIKGNFAKPGGASTSLGDLSIFTKFIVRQNPQTGNLISAGFVVTPPTGPSSFAGAKYIQSLHTTRLQPYIGYVFSRGNFYLHGFSAFEFPVNPGDVTLAYNDVGIGYFLYRNTEAVPSRWITAIVPTAEVHVNTPLNHRNPYNPLDPSASANVVNFTEGLNIEFNRRSILTLGIVTPTTSPKPFDIEALVLFNFRFGGSRRNPPPMLGG